LPNPGLAAAAKRYARKWADSSLPIIVHVMADRPEETKRMVESLEGINNVMAAELGFAPLLTDDIILTALEMSLGELPLIVSLPMEDAVRLAPRVMEAGAAAISLSPPRGSLNLTPAPSPERRGETITGRLYGPSLFPQSLEIVRRLAGAGVPVIGAGGVYTREQAEVMIEAGAMAVQVDAVLWRGGF
jgi:dihydroorotate dehydrogenase